VLLLVIVRNNKRCTVQVLKNSGQDLSGLLFIHEKSTRYTLNWNVAGAQSRYGRLG